MKGSSSKNTSKVMIEVCVDSVESALAAVRGGADRLEICANLGSGGGTTPSLGLVKIIKSRFSNTPLMVMIRPRTGDFLYTGPELSVMSEDIRQFANIGISGVVFGALNADGTVDVKAVKLLVEEAGRFGLQTCFHRAFDMVSDQMQALEALESTSARVTRILTSGGSPSAPSSITQLKALTTRLSQLTKSRPGSSLSLLPGSGINSRTVRPLLEQMFPMGVREIHLSAGSWIESDMVFKKEGMGMGVGGKGAWGLWRTREEEIREVRRIVDEIHEEYARNLKEGEA